ncbi:hypothetical protein SOVF_064760 [Spinacia oleracea]|nr:hypothetical protein SOVF_064760 [Spinacia oleracea]
MEGGQDIKLRGVTPRKNGKWGAAVTVNKKQIWLGTYETEVDAALAYDRACLKVGRLLSLNFPFVTTKEIRFQDIHSQKTIIDMVKRGTYAQEYADFLSIEALDAIIHGTESGLMSSGDNGSGGVLKEHKPVMLFGVQIG